MARGKREEFNPNRRVGRSELPRLSQVMANASYKEAMGSISRDSDARSRSFGVNAIDIAPSVSAARRHLETYRRMRDNDHPQNYDPAYLSLNARAVETMKTQIGSAFANREQYRGTPEEVDKRNLKALRRKLESE